MVWVSVSVAPDTFATKADAQRWLAVAQADILRGTFIDPSAGRISFAEWAEDWLASKPGKRATSLAWIERLCVPTSSLRSVFSP